MAQPEAVKECLTMEFDCKLVTGSENFEADEKPCHLDIDNTLQSGEERNRPKRIESKEGFAASRRPRKSASESIIPTLGTSYQSKAANSMQP